MLILFTVAVLGLSGFAGWFFFGGPDDDPTRRAMDAHISRLQAKIPEAEAGSANAQFALARLYHNGDHIAADPKAAYQWYAKAADQGHVEAQYSIGAMYANGDGVRQDYFRASEWYRLAANLGRHAGAQLALGDLYFMGQGVAHGYAEALAWYKKSALRGHPVAQYRLGAMYAEGWAGAFDPVEAYTWFTLAMAKQGQVKAHDSRLDPKAAREKLAEAMNRNQINRATDAAARFRSQK
ncbi:MAG: tetratricopeptide repeat protein [Proteobacteria bacterium]|nr:tetratricopeptide repeat protein [Pseudomonadota bacterium]